MKNTAHQITFDQRKLIGTLEFSHIASRYTIVYNNKAFSLGRLMYECLTFLHQGSSFEAASQKMYSEEGSKFNVEVENFRSLIWEELCIFFDKLQVDENDVKSSRQKYIHLRVNLLKPDKVLFFAQRFKFLLAPAIMMSVAALFVGSVLLYYNGIITVESVALNGQYKAYGYMIFLPILFFHEIGHSSAAYKFGVKPHNIGFGFYLIFPVLYADVTSIWLLSNRQRVMVNAAGVYFQMVAHLFLFTGIMISPDGPMRNVLIGAMNMNFYIMIYSMMPFFRNDGYWIYSDLFNIENLMKRAYAYPVNIAVSLWRQGLAMDKKLIYGNIPLAIFSIANYTFLIIFGYGFFKFLIQRTITCFDLVYHLKWAAEHNGMLFQLLFSYFILGVLLYNNLIKGLLTKKNNLS